MAIPIIIDVVLIALIVLFAIVGLVKGFFKSLLSMIGTIGSLLISVFLASLVCAWLLPHFPMHNLFGEGQIIHGAIDSAITGIAPDLLGTEFGGDSTHLGDGLAALGLPESVATLLAAAIGGGSFGGHTLGYVISLAITGWIYWLVIAALLFAISRIILGLLSRFFKFLTKNKLISGVNRLLGFILGGIKGTIIVALIFAVLSFFMSTPAMRSFNEELQQTAIARPFSDIVFDFVGNNIDLEKILDGIMGEQDGHDDEQHADGQ